MTSALRAPTHARSETAAWFAVAGAVIVLVGLILAMVAASLTATAELIGEFGVPRNEPDVAAALSLDHVGLAILLVGAVLVVAAIAATGSWTRSEDSTAPVRRRRRQEAEKVTEADPYAELVATRLAEAEAQRAALIRTIEDIRADRSLNFTDDEHDPEGSTVSLDQAREAALLALTERTVAELESAQQRLADGTYGICEICHREIPSQRMLARPEARRCVPCSSGRR